MPVSVMGKMFLFYEYQSLFHFHEYFCYENIVTDRHADEKPEGNPASANQVPEK